MCRYLHHSKEKPGPKAVPESPPKGQKPRPVEGQPYPQGSQEKPRRISQTQRQPSGKDKVPGKMPFLRGGDQRQYRRRGRPVKEGVTQEDFDQGQKGRDTTTQNHSLSYLRCHFRVLPGVQAKKKGNSQHHKAPEKPVGVVRQGSREGHGGLRGNEGRNNHHQGKKKATKACLAKVTPAWLLDLKIILKTVQAVLFSQRSGGL